MLNPVKIIVDTNLWISFLISRDFKRLDQQILSEEVKLTVRRANMRFNHPDNQSL